MPFLAPVVGIVGALASAGGSILGGMSSAASADYQAQIARNYAQIAGVRATQAAAAGQEQAQEKSLQSAQQLARIRTAIAANGVDVNSGSAEDTQVSQRAVNALDTQNVMHNAELSVYGYQTQGMNYQAQAQLDQAEAQSDMTGGIFGGAASLLKASTSIPGLGLIGNAAASGGNAYTSSSQGLSPY